MIYTNSGALFPAMNQIRRFQTVPIGSPDLYLAVHAALVTKGSSLNKWCKANGINTQTATKALQGLRHSKAAEQIRARLAAELFGEEEAA